MMLGLRLIGKILVQDFCGYKLMKLKIDEGICMVARYDDSFTVFVWISAFDAMSVKTCLKC